MTACRVRNAETERVGSSRNTSRSACLPASTLPSVSAWSSHSAGRMVAAFSASATGIPASTMNSSSRTVALVSS